MSLDPQPAAFPTLVVWDGRCGVVRHCGVQVDLDHMPRDLLPGLVVRGLRYLPASRDGEVRESGQAWRRLTLVEIDHIDEFLERLASAAFAVTGPGAL